MTTKAGQAFSRWTHASCLFLCCFGILATVGARAAQLPLPLDASSVEQYPYNMVGKVISSKGVLGSGSSWGSGCAVHVNVVLTCAHVVFNRPLLMWRHADSLRWSRKHAPTVYADTMPRARRIIKWTEYEEAMLTTSASPGESNPEDFDLDVSCLFFYEAVANGRYAGVVSHGLDRENYRTSKTEGWLIFGTSLDYTLYSPQMIVGYPNLDYLASDTRRDRMHATPAGFRPNFYRYVEVDFTGGPPTFDVSARYCMTEDLSTGPGNSGGPVFTQLSGDWYVAGVVVSKSRTGYTSCGAVEIDDRVVMMLNEAIGATDEATVQNGETVNIAGAAGSEKFFKIFVPQDVSELEIGILRSAFGEGAGGDADLYVKHGARPSVSDFDERSVTRRGGGYSVEDLVIDNPEPGEHCIMVKGYSSYSGLFLRASYATPDVTGIHPGSPIFGLQDSLSQKRYFRVDVTSPDARDLYIATSGGSGNADLYVAYEAFPVTNAGYHGYGGAVTRDLDGQRLSHAAQAGSSSRSTSSMTLRRGTGPDNEESVTIRNPSAGRYYALICGAYDGMAIEADYSIAASEMVNGVPVQGLSGQQALLRYYRILVPAGCTSFSVAAEGGSGDADLYVSREKTPTTDEYGWKSSSSGNRETVQIAEPSPGTYFILCHAWYDYADVTLKATYACDGFVCDVQNGAAPCAVVFVADAHVGAVDNATTWFSWDFDGDGAADTEGYGLTVVTNTYALAGEYPVSLSVSGMAGGTTVHSMPGRIHVAPETVYVSPEGAHAYPFATWANAATNIQSGVNAAADGGVVLVTNGVFVVDRPVVLTNAVTLRSVREQFPTVVDGGRASRCFQLLHDGAAVDGFVIKNGFASTGAGVFCRKGLVANCIVSDNHATGNGGGIRCGRGGGVLNCTVTANSAEGEGSGLYCYGGGRIRNTVIYGNTHDDYATDLSRYSIEYCCVTSMPRHGYGNIDADPQFADPLAGLYHVLPASPCIDAGVSTDDGADSDIQGGPRLIGEGVDIGAFEYGTLRCFATATPRWTTQGSPVVFTAHVTGTNTQGLSYWWDLDCDGEWDVAGQDARVVTNVYPAAGMYSVRLRARNAIGSSAVSVQDACIRIDGADATIHVSPEGTHEYPYLSWATAANDIKSAVDAARDGNTVLVTNGTYAISERITTTNGVVIRSVGGASAAVVSGDHITGCFYLSHSNAVLDGFTVRDGKRPEGYGGGGVVLWYGTVQNCVITGNTSTNNRGGGMWVRSGIVRNCVLTGNTAPKWWGGGLYATLGSVVEDCTFKSNSAPHGGGVMCYMGTTVRRCVFSGNEASSSGGGLSSVRGSETQDGCKIEACTFFDNRARYRGGGISAGDSLVTDCVISRNRSADEGGGVYAYDTLLTGCTVTLNSAIKGGGVYQRGYVSSVPAYGSKIHGCSVVSNSATHGGGIYATNGCRVTACVVSDNSAVLTGGGVVTFPACVEWDTLEGIDAQATVENCVIARNEAVFEGGGGVWTRGTTIRNCTIVDNRCGDQGAGIYSLDDSAVVVNTIIYDNAAGIHDNYSVGSGSSWPVLMNCCTVPLPPSGHGNVTDAPLFVNADASDYGLRRSSPCVDSGYSPHAPTTDIHGTRRPLDGNCDGVPSVDIGACELDPGRMDTDKDGMSDADESLAGTDPMDGSDTFALKMLSRPQNAGNRGFSWRAVAERTYTVQFCTDLTNPIWQDVPGWSSLRGRNGTMAFVDGVIDTRVRFYRVLVSPLPPSESL